MRPKYYVLLLSLLAFSSQVYAGVEMADQLRSSGKIYGVLMVILIIFTGIILLLIRMERRIGKLERKLKDKEKPSR